MLPFPLINRTHFSIHHAFSKPNELAKASKEAGFTHCGICDFGNVSGAVEFFEACQKSSIVPVIGCDFGAAKVFSLNKSGWNELIKLVTEFNCDNFLNQATLNSPNLVVLHSVDFEGLPDSRYILEEDEAMYGLVRALGLKCKISELTEPTHFPFPLVVADHPIFAKFENLEEYSILGAPKLPHFGESGDEIGLLRRHVERGFRNKLGDLNDDKLKEYRDRVEYEMKVIDLANLAGYFLIVSDFVNKARSDNQLCSVGRGSSSGSLVSFLTGINLVDPIPYNLLFSRFFNAARAYPKHLSFDEYGFIDEWRDFESKLASPKRTK